MRHTLILLALLPTILEVGRHESCLGSNINKVSKISAEDEKCLAVTIYGEARSEPEKGQIAVAYTVLNRAVNKTLCQVVLSPKQYSVFNNNPALRAAAITVKLEPYQKNIIDQNSWDQSVKVARLVATGMVNDPTDGATHYLADKVMKLKGYRYPKWSKQYTVVAVINDHKFYKKI